MLRRALGVADDVVAGDPVRLMPLAWSRIDGVIDCATDGVLRHARRRRAVPPLRARHVGLAGGVAHDLFADGVDQAASERAWGDWVAGVLERERLA
jgi:hypothetical protein